MTPKLNPTERIALIKRVIEGGEPVAKVCREVGISRVLFYRWLARYKEKGASALQPKPRGRPKATPTERVTRPLAPKQRLEMLERVIVAGEPVSKIAREYGISRTLFYRLLKRYKEAPEEERLEALEPKKAYIERYFRQTPERFEKAVLALIAKHPEYGVRRLVANLPRVAGVPIIGHHGVQNILRRAGLSLYEQRLVWSQAQVTPVTRAIGEIVSYLSRFIALPVEVRAQVIRFTGITAISAFLTIVILGIGGFWLTVVSGVPLAARVGFVFASTALLVGSLFFLYSMKYYFTLAIVLSFSQQASPFAEASGDKGNGNGRRPGEASGPEGRRNGILSWLLGLGNGINGGSSLPRAQRGVGLEPSLEHVTLERKPFVSVHIPLYNEKNVAERILAAVTAFDWGNYEVIVADDSTDETTAIVQKFIEQWKSQNTNHKIQIKHIHRTSRSGFKGGALAEALKHTDPRAEFIVVFDADFVPYPDTLELFLKYFKVQNNMSEDYTKSQVAVVQGYQWHVLNKSENWITRGVRAEYAGSYVIERSGTEILGALKMIAGSVYMVRRDLLERFGWGTSITEDFQLTLRLYEAGYKVVYTPYIQAPAECVSTIQRLVRQRMRWAEGHSHNIRMMLTRLLFGHWKERTDDRGLMTETEDRRQKTENQPSTFSPQNQSSVFRPQSSRVWIPSPLTLMEKLEFLYLSPYYLQAFFFLLGTLSWLLAETLFPARLPFWTSLWGWSLVLTNFLSLPLMNAVGMFLEEAEERDYLGIISFLALSYILVPFQAYAAIKGFLEREEGPWFRTPKTGRITDIFTRGRFYRLIAGILPGRTGNRAQGIGYSSLNPNAHTLNPYLSLATANSRFNSFNIKPRSLGARWVGRVLVTVFLIISTTLLHFSPSIPSYPDEVIANGTDFRWDQTPRLILDLKGARSLKQSILPKTNEVYAKGEEGVSTKVYYQGEEKDIPVGVKELEGGRLEVALLSNESVRPGKYRVEVTAKRYGKDVSISQDFTWGVLAINTDKSIYLPGDKAKLTFSVLNDSGHMVCDAFLRLKIITPEGKAAYFSTEDVTIKVNPECELKGYTEIPDYEAEYEVGEAGRYEMELSALTENGPRSIEDSFEVRDWVPFDIKREGPTRIYPLASYPVNLKVKVNEDFKGQVIESVPDSFEIKNPTIPTSEVFADSTSEVKKISWQVDWKKGETYELSYVFNAPIISPEFYLMGPLKIGTRQQGLGFREEFKEARQWQVASDSTQPSVQDVTGQTADAVSQVVVSNVPGGTDQLYIAIVHLYTNGGSPGTSEVSSMSGGSGLTWDLVNGTVGCTARINQPRTEWWWAFGSPSTFNLTVNLANATLAAGAHVAVVRIDGAVNQEPINGEYSNTNGDNGACDRSGTDNTAPTIGLTISNSTSLALNSAFPRNQSNGVSTPDTNYTQDYEVLNISGGNASTIWAGHRTTSPAVGTETITHSLGSARPWIMVAAEIVVPEYSLIWLGLAPVLPGLIAKIKRRKRV